MQKNKDIKTPIYKDAYHPQELKQTYTLCGKRFQLYSLELFTFNRALDVGVTGKGLYCFTDRYKGRLSDDDNHFIYAHHPIYLGKTSGVETRPYEHEKFSQLKESNTLGIYLCQNDEDPKEIESTILETYFFKLNDKENKDVGDRKITITED